MTMKIALQHQSSQHGLLPDRNFFMLKQMYLCVIHMCERFDLHIHMNNLIYSTLLEIQERKSDRRSKEIEQRKESQNTHETRTDM